MTVRGLGCWWRAGRGQLTAFVVTVMLGLLAMAGLSLDGGLALATRIRADGEAESAARAGAQAVDIAAYRATGRIRLDAARADMLARRYLEGIAAAGTVAVGGDTVTVEVTRTYRTQLLSLIGVRDIPTRGHGAAHPQRGITGLEP
ncbi:pilus assembly protein TadG-related protein [Amycolatopsis benzoatilytica]|uniref:pilus assembly protein TadG-related protein n=1 Tax=Amycolatopsis benzoatilytica TaxID=346045 RepID=UPI000377102F|nr:pilus assembly protein TadG-related protein [Amycolatopsis benzoatilytica]